MRFPDTRPSAPRTLVAVSEELIPPDTPSPWAIASGPEEVEQIEREDIRVAWAWTIQRGGDRHTVHVLVAAQAISAPVDAGRSLVAANLKLDDPPRTILLSE